MGSLDFLWVLQLHPAPLLPPMYLHSTPLHPIPPHSTLLHPTPSHSTPLHPTPPQRGVNSFADRRIWAFFVHGLWILAINYADSRIWKIPWIADQLKMLAWIPDSAGLEVCIVDRIIHFRSALVNILVFCLLTFQFFSRHKIFCNHIRWTITLDHYTSIGNSINWMQLTFLPPHS